MPNTTNSAGQLVRLPREVYFIQVPNSAFASLSGTTPPGQQPPTGSAVADVLDGKITFQVLPDVSDSKGASYNDEPIMGRATPLKTYSHSENRSISVGLHLFVLEPADVYINFTIMRLIQSAVYPRTTDTNGAPYLPPVVCQIRIGNLLSDSVVCAVLKTYSTKFPTDVAWDPQTGLPYKFDIETTWEVVYDAAADPNNPLSGLPGQNRIIQSGV